MSEWKECRLTEVCDTISETYKDSAKKVVLINTSDVLEGKITNHKFVDNKNLAGQFKKKFQKNDILYSEIRPANKRYAFVDIDPKDYIASTKLMVLRSKSFILPKYLYYLLTNKNTIRELHAIAVGRSGTFPQITYSELSNIKFKLPPIEIQEIILSFLLNLDDKISVNKKICENLEAQAQALFKHWFIDFAPFKDGKFVESELGMIPEGWRVGTLTEIADYMNGLAMQKFPPTSVEDSIPVLKIKELGQSMCDSNSDRCSKLIKPEYIINNGDIIFSWSGTLLVDIWCGGVCGLNQHLFKVSSKEYPKWFYLMWTKHHLGEFIRIAKDKAVTMGHIKRGDLEKAKVAIPGAKDMGTISPLMEELLDKIVNCRLESSRLSTLRDTLLPRLMSGEIKL